MQRQWLRVLAVAAIPCIVVGVLACCIFCFSFQSTPIAATVEEVGLCQGPGPDGEPEGLTSVVSSDSDRIYLYMRLESNTWTTVRFRWYYDGQLLGVFTQRYNPGLSYTWLEHPPGQTFREGTYHVDVVVGGRVVETLNFQVRAPNE